MSETDELRKLLDERGVEHRDVSHITLWGRHTYDSIDYYDYVVNEIEGQLCLSMHDVTPAQAVAATLGRGECEIEERRDGWGVITRHCGNCGADLDCDTRNRQNYCPSCGLRLVRR